MLGSSVMVVPILEENFNRSYIQAYLPLGYWYNHYTTSATESLGEMKYLPVNTDSIPILYRGGSIIMKQDALLNTVESRKGKFLIQAFLSKYDTAEGEFFWDDGVSNRKFRIHRKS
jgi:alpha-glucosidase (family GH31 glycosyl hydrolase)